MLGDWLSEGVNLYSSTDLMTWHYEGLIFNATAQITGLPSDPPHRIERPKVRTQPSQPKHPGLSWLDWRGCLPEGLKSAGRDEKAHCCAGAQNADRV
jgi:hypothetical protein